MSGRRLLLFAPSAYPLGGVATWASYLLPGLRSHGWQPTLALTKGRHHDPEAYLAVHPYAPAIVVPCGVGVQAARVRHAAEAITQTRPDIVAFAGLPDVALAVRRLRRHGGFAGKLATIEHGIDRETMLDIRRLAGSLDAVIGVNQLVCRLARIFAGLAPERVFYAPNGVEARSFARQSRAVSGAKLCLLFAGRLDQPQKRVHDLPDLADELARRGVPFRLEIAGAGPEEAALRKRFARAAYEVSFLGVVPHRELCEAVLRRADALLVLSPSETGPLVAFEAMAAGVAVAASRFVGSRAEAALRDGVNCLMFPVGDMRAAADVVARLCDVSLRARLAEAGRELVAARYSRDASIARWDEALNDILDLPALGRETEPERLVAGGRLERWFGPRAGERIASAFGRAYPHREPGGEWPHLLTRSEAEGEIYERALSNAETGVGV